MIQEFTVDNMNTMDAMHDAIVTNISIHENILEIEYDNLDILDPEGKPLYPFNKVTISYEMRKLNDPFPYCDVIVYYGKNKYKYIEIEKLIELNKKMLLESYVYRIDSFKRLTLAFDFGRPKKWWGVEILLDPPIKITYNWEGEPTQF